MLAGGRSSRMGTPKAGLEWHGSTLLRRVVGIVGRSVDGPLIVVRRRTRSFRRSRPTSRSSRTHARAGARCRGSSRARRRARPAPVAYASSTDVPFLHPMFVHRVLAAEDDARRASRNPRVPQPLAAAYRVELLDVVARLIAEDRMRPAFLFEACRMRRLDADALLLDPALAALDPELDSVLNLNEPGDYEAARARPGPEVIVRRFGVLRRWPPAPPATRSVVPAATLARGRRRRWGWRSTSTSSPR